MNRVTAQVNPLGERTSYAYNPDGQQTRVANPLGAVTTTVTVTTRTRIESRRDGLRALPLSLMSARVGGSTLNASAC